MFIFDVAKFRRSIYPMFFFQEILLEVSMDPKRIVIVT